MSTGPGMTVWLPAYEIREQGKCWIEFEDTVGISVLAGKGEGPRGVNHGNG